MTDQPSLYTQRLLDHAKHPRNQGVLADATAAATLENALCGDAVTVYCRIEDGRVAAATFTGHGCAVSKASASMMTEMVTERTLDEVEALCGRFAAFLDNHLEGAGEPADMPEPLQAFESVRAHPVRIRCALLPWRALGMAVRGR